MGVVSVASADAFDAATAGKDVCVCNFRASWAEPCVQMDEVFARLAGEHGARAGVAFVQVESEEAEAVAERLQVETVPTFVVLKSGAPTDRLVGANAPELVALVGRVVGAEAGVPAAGAAAGGKPQTLDERLKGLIESSPTMLFMKGSPDAPRCGFSRQIVELLRAQAVEFGSFDILSDEEVRQGLKTFSNWPTYPQLYAHGKLVGGLDVVKELAEEGELADSLSGAA